MIVILSVKILIFNAFIIIISFLLIGLIIIKGLNFIMKINLVDRSFLLLGIRIKIIIIKIIGF